MYEIYFFLTYTYMKTNKIKKKNIFACYLIETVFVFFTENFVLWKVLWNFPEILTVILAAVT